MKWNKINLFLFYFFYSKSPELKEQEDKLEKLRELEREIQTGECQENATHKGNWVCKK